MLIAFAHIIGSLISIAILTILINKFNVWKILRIEAKMLESLSVELGIIITKDNFNDKGVEQKITQHLSDRFSDELIKNRIPDFIGTLLTIWIWIGEFVSFAILITTLWNSFSENSEYAIYAWFIVGVSILFWIVSVISSIVCKIITGRYPGQAKAARKELFDKLAIN